MARSVSESASMTALVQRRPGHCHGVAGRTYSQANHPHAGAIARWALRRAPRRKVVTP